MTIRRRVAVELATLAVLASTFLTLLPERPVWVDALLGLVAVTLVVATARTTREQIWAPATARRDPVRHAWRDLLIGTLGVALLFAIIGRWTGRAGPVFTATMRFLASHSLVRVVPGAVVVLSSFSPL